MPIQPKNQVSLDEFNKIKKQLDILKNKCHEFVSKSD